MKQKILNLGCGFDYVDGMVNVDAYKVCKPDVLWDLDKHPWPWADNSVDGIMAKHIFEHIPDWWGAFTECGRILRPGGFLDMRVPDESSGSALTFRDHIHVFSLVSFHGSVGATHGTSAWAKSVNDSVPLMLKDHKRVPFPQYNWMPRWMLRFCGNHLRNFIWEQRFTFMKINSDRGM